MFYTYDEINLCLYICENVRNNHWLLTNTNLYLIRKANTFLIIDMYIYLQTPHGPAVAHKIFASVVSSQRLHVPAVGFILNVTTNMWRAVWAGLIVFRKVPRQLETADAQECFNNFALWQ